MTTETRADPHSKIATDGDPTPLPDETPATPPPPPEPERRLNGRPIWWPSR